MSCLAKTIATVAKGFPVERDAIYGLQDRLVGIVKGSPEYNLLVRVFRNQIKAMKAESVERSVAVQLLFAWAQDNNVDLRSL
jgi:hypothetical protein